PEPKHGGQPDDEKEPVECRRRRPGTDHGEPAGAASDLSGGALGDCKGDTAVARRLSEVAMLDTETATDVVQIEFPAGLPGFPHEAAQVVLPNSGYSVRAPLALAS